MIVGTDTTKYTFDQLNRLKAVTDPDGGMTTYSYDKNGNRESVIYPNGTVAEYTYDTLNRLTKLFNRTSTGDTISCYEYTLGISGNRTRVEEHTGRTVDYSYDDTYKLTSEIINDPVFGMKTISYTYDAVGNRLTKTEDGETTTYVYDDNDRLLNEVTASENTTYSYDDNGNTLSKTSLYEDISYGYDYNNRLIQVDNGTDVIAYAYDTDGMRVQKTINGNVTNYLLDKNRDYAQVLRENDGSGNEIVSYICGDDLISQKRSSLKSFYHYDGQLSTRQLTDATAQITDEYTYDAFGLLLQRTGSTLNNYMYTGEQYDPNVGFYYLRFRYYNPTNGRFLTMDTWPGMQFEPMSLHKYLYCESGPVGRWDPSGKIPTLLGQVIKMTIIGALIGGVSYITGFLLGKALGSDKEFSVKELLLSIGIGAIANGLGAYIHAGFAVSVGGIQLVAHLSVLFNMIQNGILSAYYYCQINKNSNEGISANGFFVSTALGVLAAGFAGPGGSTFIRGATSNLSAQTLESLVAGFREFIKTVKDTDYQFLMEEFIRKYESQYLRYGPLRLRR